MYANSNRNWTPIDVIDGPPPADRTVVVRRSGDATHALIYLRETAGAPWADNVRVTVLGAAETRGADGRPTLPTLTDIVSGIAPKTIAPYAGATGAGEVRAVVAGATLDGGFPGVPVILAVPFGPFEGIILALSPDSGGADEVAEYAVQLAKLANDATILTTAAATVAAATVAAGASVPAVYSLSITAGSETGDSAPLSLKVLDQLGATPTGLGPFSIWLFASDDATDGPITVDIAPTAGASGTVESADGFFRFMLATDADGVWTGSYDDNVGASDLTANLDAVLFGVTNDGAIASASVVFDAQ